MEICEPSYLPARTCSLRVITGYYLERGELQRVLGTSERIADVANPQFYRVTLTNNITLGNTPTLNGAPISLDWEYDPSETVILILTHMNNIDVIPIHKIHVGPRVNYTCYPPIGNTY